MVKTMGNLRYDMERPLFHTAQIKLLYISTSKYEGDWHSTLHAHNCTELFYMVNGMGYFVVEDEEFPVSAGDVVIINPNVMHTETGTPKTPMEYIVLGIQGGEFLAQDSDDSRYCILHRNPQGNDLVEIIKAILAEMEERHNHFETVAHSFLEILSVKLLRSKSVSMQEAPQNRARHDCAKVKRYIDAHFKEHITLDVLAEMAHFNKHYLVHSFSREMGISPISYLTQKRIEESRFFLAQTDISISDISQIIGFSSPCYFSQSFSRVAKMSPRDYRRKMRNDVRLVVNE